MFEIIQAIILGIVQGLTEFIPVSSSAHLVLIPWLLGWDKPSLLFDTMLHWGTLVSILLVFWRDFWDIMIASLRSVWTRSLADANARLGWFVVVGTIPTAVLGLLFSDFVEDLFGSPAAAAGFLIVTGLLLIGSEQMVRHLRQSRSLTQLNLVDSILVGCAQALALAPGISRSGSTIAAGLVRGIRREDAARFSFFLGTPAFFGAGLLQLVKAVNVGADALVAQAPVLVIGLVVSAISGYVAIRFLLAYLRTHTLYLFAAYCLIVGPLMLVLTLVWQ